MGNKSFRNVENLRYLGRKPTNEIYIHEEIKMPRQIMKIDRYKYE
jgi:hypothetical protein